MEQLNVLLIGSGGREHALAWAIAKSPILKKLYIAPGNPGTASLGENISLDLEDFDDVLAFAEDNEIDLVVVGPEQPLVDGITDYLTDYGITVFGPTKAAAALEGSKSYAKSIMQKYGIPTAGYEVFERHEIAKLESYLEEQAVYPVVLKADGLAAGKGVFICHNPVEAAEYIDRIMNDVNLSAAASLIVVEEFMQGEEVSVFAFSDGVTARYLMHAQDHKRIGDGDTGLNTGGMGAYAPAPVLDDSGVKHVMDTIISPMIDAMGSEETPYVGMLYCGLMMTAEGPKVVEFNCRFGDPECQVMMPALKSDLLELMAMTVHGKLEYASIQTHAGYYCSVVMASEGYPESYEKGFPISGISEALKGAEVFFSGVNDTGSGELITSGGRVLNVVGHGETLKEAIDNAYHSVSQIKFDNAYYRNEIGNKGLHYFSA
jgi:phosphoribosylamine---glycine ligase